MDSQKAVPVTHKFTLPDLFSFQSVTAPFPATGWPHGENGGGRERPPLFAARCGRGGVAQFTFAQHPLGGSLPSQFSLREGPEEDRGPGGPVPPDPPGAPEPRSAHQADREPDARSGGASPPEPPGCEETHTHQRTLQRGIEPRLNEPPHRVENQRFPTGCVVLPPVQCCHRSLKPPAPPVQFTFSPGSPEPRTLSMSAWPSRWNPWPDRLPSP